MCGVHTSFNLSINTNEEDSRSYRLISDITALKTSAYKPVTKPSKASIPCTVSVCPTFSPVLGLLRKINRINICKNITKAKQQVYYMIVFKPFHILYKNNITTKQIIFQKVSVILS